MLREKIASEDVVVLFEAQVDWELFYLFENAHIVRSIDEASTVLGAASRVVTERYHGAIIALRLGLPTIAVYRNDHNASKLRSLFEAIGAPLYCLSEDQVATYRTQDYGMFPEAAVQASLEELEALFHENAMHLLEQLLATDSVQGIP